MPQPTPIPLDQVDLTDLDAFARNEGWAMFDTLRAEDPVHWTPEAPPNSGFWAVTRYEDVDAVDRDAAIFTSTKYVNLEEVDDDLMDLRRSMSITFFATGMRSSWSVGGRMPSPSRSRPVSSISQGVPFRV